MLLRLAGSLIVFLFAVAYAQSTLNLLYPTGPRNGDYNSLRWDGGVAPYTVTVLDVNTSVIFYRYYGSDNITYWNVTLAAGTFVKFQIIDSAGTTASSPPIDILPSVAAVSISQASVASSISVEIVSSQSIASVSSLSVLPSVSSESLLSVISTSLAALSTGTRTTTASSSGSPSQTGTSSSGTTDKTPTIIGGVVGGVVGLALVLVLIYHLMMRSKTPGTPLGAGLSSNGGDPRGDYNVVNGVYGAGAGAGIPSEMIQQNVQNPNVNTPMGVGMNVGVPSSDYNGLSSTYQQQQQQQQSPSSAPYGTYGGFIQQPQPQYATYSNPLLRQGIYTIPESSPPSTDSGVSNPSLSYSSSGLVQSSAFPTSTSQPPSSSYLPTSAYATTSYAPSSYAASSIVPTYRTKSPTGPPPY